MLKEITTEELSARIEKPGLKLIDVRPVDAYNGWTLKGEGRGGHISGARCLPAKWADYIDWLDIIQSKGLTPEDELVIYGYQPEEIDKVGRQFTKAGYDNVRAYYSFVDEWSANEEYPMDSLVRHKHLVPAEWVYDLTINKINPDTRESLQNSDRRFVICHSHYRNHADYQTGHIPGAVALDTNWLEDTETWNRRSPGELKETLESLGITSDSTVIVYGRFSFPDNNDPYPGSSAGHLGAFRCAFLMLYAGLQDVRILNGGMQAWEDAGYELSTEEVEPQPVSDFGSNIPGAPELVTDLEEAERILESNDKNLVSVRSWSEFIGEVSGYNYIEKKGRIPGAVFANCGSDAYHMENDRNLDHTTREFHEVEKNWAEVGIIPDKHNAFYCGTGWRGSEAFFNAWLMGWPDISVFDGGWFEWSNAGKPYETGIPEKMPASK